MSALIIRRARASDAPRLTAIALASQRDWGYPATRLQAFRPRLTITPGYIRAHPVFVARTGRRILGFLALVRTEKWWSLEHLRIHPDAVARGIGRRLWTHALAYLNRRGPRLLRIVAEPQAAGFYQHMGARRAGSVAAPIGRMARLSRFELRL